MVSSIIDIINLNNYLDNQDNFNHLFKVQLPHENLKLWKVRYKIDLGTFIVGDLLLNLEEENSFEVHPFPEWVVYLKTLQNLTSKPYLIVPKLSKLFIKNLERKKIHKKIELIQDEMNNINIDDILAFEYELGINILVPAFIPHTFLSSKIQYEDGEKPPFLQVFEPNIEHITKSLKIEPTHFFQLPFSFKI
jgi:hypothetical protein